jgi:hypothetical protein
MPQKLRKNLIVDIEFRDHVEGPGTCKFVVSGKVAALTERDVCIDCWRYSNPRRKYDSNVTRFTILRSAITKIWVHTPELIFSAPD